MTIIQLIASSNFITVNKDLIKLLGIDEAIILGELASEYDYWSKRDELQDDYFYSTIENIENNTTLSEHKQRKALNKLKSLNLIDIKIKGIPAKRYIKINEEQVLKILNIQFLKNSGTSPLKVKELDIQKFKGNNNIDNNNIKNNNKNNIYIPYKEIIDYLNMRTGSNYKHTTNKTKDLIKARFNEGFTIDDFKVVIDKKCMEWINDTNMNKYLRPETLFSPKFESYLNQPMKEQKLTTKDVAIDVSDF